MQRSVERQRVDSLLGWYSEEELQVGAETNHSVEPEPVGNGDVHALALAAVETFIEVLRETIPCWRGLNSSSGVRASTTTGSHQAAMTQLVPPTTQGDWEINTTEMSRVWELT